jgi:hypothetical protein
MRICRRTAVVALLALLATSAVAQQPATGATRLRGTVERADATSLVVKESDGREVVLIYADDLRVTEIVPIDPSALQAGVFVGTTAMPGPDGSLSAVEIHVFAESARGTAEGHGPMTTLPNATMTNATVASITQGANERTIVLRYKDGEKTIRVPDGVPIIAQRRGDKSMLLAGAKVTVIEQLRDGRAVATRIAVGRNGFTPPT